MSYARFSEGDVYVFASQWGIECCGCRLVERQWVDDPISVIGGYLKAVHEGERDLVTRDAAEFVTHLERHRAVGHEVPQDCIDRLLDPADAKWREEMWAQHDAEAVR